MQERQCPLFLVVSSKIFRARPPELLRTGRFYEFFFDYLPTAAERRTIFAIHLAGRNQDPAQFDLARLAAASEGFSGAEIEQAIASALYTAFSAKSPLSTEIILKELQSTFPLSATVREKVEALRQWACDRAVPAG